MKRAAVVAAATLSLACGGSATDPSSPAPSGSMVVFALANLPPLDATRDGAYEAWLVDGAGAARSIGRFVPPPDGHVTLPAATAGAVGVQVTLERPGPAARTPSSQVLLRGRFQGRSASLSLDGAVTRGGLPLRPRPGQFTMFTPSNNAAKGYPSDEEAGIWLFNMAPRLTEQNDMWVRLTPLQPGWIYEGWMVRDYGAPQAVWLSYGKFLPDAGGAVNTRDDTGWGPFSGVLDFRTAGEEEFPGDDWISNPLGLPIPGNLTLPLNLTEKTLAGGSRWTHVITVEPVWKLGEPLTTERPFVIRAYRDPFGDGGPGVPRTITYRADGVPGGTAEVR
ncbi:MAG: hypothetical protein NVS1B4_17950 [Gemmatimonadaceae bacterium]